MLGLLISVALGTALALVFSAANVFMRDVGNAVSVLTNFVRFGVPMMYPFSYVEEALSPFWVQVYLANPITDAVLLMQRCFWTGTTEHPRRRSWCTCRTT